MVIRLVLEDTMLNMVYSQRIPLSKEYSKPSKNLTRTANKSLRVLINFLELLLALIL